MSAARSPSPMRKALERLGLTRDIDLCLHLPLRYEDETRIVRLADARDGEEVLIALTVRTARVTPGPRRQLVLQGGDGSGECTLRFFHLYPTQEKAFAPGTRWRARGVLRRGFGGDVMLHPVMRPAHVELARTLTPVYPTAAGLPQAWLRKAISAALERADWSDTVVLPGAWDEAPARVLGLRESLMALHHPDPDVALATLEDRTHPAWQRLKAEELLAQQLSQRVARCERDAQRAPPLMGTMDGVSARLLGQLPFALTAAQHRVVREITADLARERPMHRLLQGDVGSGKTVVAAMAAAVAMDSGWQCVLMAPTEILAEQHFRKLVGWLEPLGIRAAWLTGSQRKRERTQMLESIASGQAGLVVGTQAVIQQQVRFQRLALAIIDEQHRFGVAQRLALRTKAAAAAEPDSLGSEPGGPVEPHLLMMSATPIPRTLAMSYYADLDVSTLDELPPGRPPVVTRVVSDQRRDEVIERIRQQVAAGRQVYWVCPLIEESEALDLTNATATHALLCDALPGLTVALLHSRMPAAEKKAVMERFAAGQTAVLVSTTVIEVGVDVPNASLMVVEHAERFGLSQLHQLRGRVGRGAAASACVLLYSAPAGGRLGDAARERLRAMAESEDGFEIARRDLAIRGPGEFLGARQSGAPLLRFADLSNDGPWLEWARTVAPQLLRLAPEAAQRHIQRWMGGKSDFFKA